jgi:hypothetical protein
MFNSAQGSPSDWEQQLYEAAFVLGNLDYAIAEEEEKLRGMRRSRRAALLYLQDLECLYHPLLNSLPPTLDDSPIEHANINLYSSRNKPLLSVPVPLSLAAGDTPAQTFH